MKNKLLARIAASAISVAMLGTAVFAADPAINKTDTAATLTFLVGAENADISKDATQDQITMMAYLVDGSATAEAIPAYADEATTPMIALDQVGGAAGFGEIPVDVNKLADGKKIAVKLGCSAGTVQEFLIGLSSDGKTITFTFGDATEDGSVTAADINAIKVYLKKGAHPKYTKINTAADENGIYVYGDATEDKSVTAADINAIKVYLKKGAHPKYTKINTTEDIVVNK